MRELFSAYIAVLTLAVIGIAQNPGPKYRDSIRSSCLDSSFLSISAHTLRHDGFPDVELRLTDPKGHVTGNGSRENEIPNSQYGQIVEIPQHPTLSKAVAVEVCQAVQGRYAFTVTEHGGSQYRITVRGNDGKDGNESQVLSFQAHGDRTCQYRFYFLMAEGKVSIRWLDTNDHPLPFLERPECEAVPRT